MGRKNNNVRRSNDKGRMTRRMKGESPMPQVKAQPRISIEDMVLPDGQCRFQTPRRPKARFATREKADIALKQAQQQRARTGTGHVEKRVYECPEGGCGGFHLTSRETFDDGVRQFRQQQFEQQTKNAARREGAA
jgi:hypothetical protein